MIKKLMIVLSVITLLTATGCAGSRLKAPTAANGAKLSIAIVTDRGIGADFDQVKVKQYNTVGNWMERDLVTMLNSAGYEAQLISSSDKFVAGPGSYLLKVKIVNYNPGNKAARMLVGFGAGATSIDTRYEFYGAGKDALLTKDHGVGSSIEWTNCARKLNGDMVQELTAKLVEHGQSV